MVFNQIWLDDASVVITGPVHGLHINNDINSETLNNLYETIRHTDLIFSIEQSMVYCFICYFLNILFSQKKKKNRKSIMGVYSRLAVSHVRHL